MAADLTSMIATIQAVEGVVESATSFINGFAKRLQDAVDAALANGATAAELKPVQDEVDAAKAKADTLAAAIAANP
jgi:hypothetical protein